MSNFMWIKLMSPVELAEFLDDVERGEYCVTWREWLREEHEEDDDE